jgi:hypothetical protein
MISGEVEAVNAAVLSGKLQQAASGLVERSTYIQSVLGAL